MLFFICVYLFFFTLSTTLNASFSAKNFPPIQEQPETSDLSSTPQQKNKRLQNLANLGQQNILILFNLVGQSPDIVSLKDEITGTLKFIRGPRYLFNTTDQSLCKIMAQLHLFDPINDIEQKIAQSLNPIEMLYSIKTMPSITLSYKHHLQYFRATRDNAKLAQLPHGLLVPENLLQPLYARLTHLAHNWPEGVVFLWEKCKNPSYTDYFNPDDACYINTELAYYSLVNQAGNPLPFVASIMSIWLEKVTFNNIDPKTCAALIAMDESTQPLSVVQKKNV